MSLFAPRTPGEAAWQQWNYGGGAKSGEPMPQMGGLMGELMQRQSNPTSQAPAGDQMLQMGNYPPMSARQSPSPPVTSQFGYQGGGLMGKMLSQAGGSMRPRPQREAVPNYGSRP